jgi:hypothetical protein
MSAMLPGSSALTALSHLSASKNVKALALALARASQRWCKVLLLSSMATLTGPGCLVADPPEYTEPQSTRPHVVINASEPPTLYPIRLLKPGPGKQFTITIESEDAGEDLVLAFFVNYGRPGAFHHRSFRLAGSTSLTKQDTFVLEAPATLADGCHSLTMLAMHESSWDGVTLVPYPSRLNDVSHTHWQLYINVKEEEVPQCPGPTTSSSPP